ncbi:MAG TPA: serine/threonine-protein kinase [Planctomycetota bacterium]|nr:serine/threonine-protein kinase [Planctomycetota bacterium]
MPENESKSNPEDSWNRNLRRALSDGTSPTSSTWLMPDKSATPLPEPGPAPSLKTPDEGALLAEPYQVVGEVGRGGIGIVLQARDLTLGREVAVKVLQPKHQTNIAAVTRFTREAKIAAQLQHPGIVPIYAAGLDNLDRPYIAMKLLRGSTLEELLRKRRDPKEGRAGNIRIFEQICQTMAYAHSRGVIHRDLKPGNVMVGAFGEVQIIDWGFARVLGTPASFEETKDLLLVDQALSAQESSALSVAGVPIGTPAYMAPEQAKGDLKAIDQRTDVFCLGSILAEILTGRPPHASSSVREVMDEAVRGDVRPAHERLDKSGAEAELVALAKDCLQPAKEARPRNAAEVAARISSFLSAAAERARQAELSAEQERTRAREERRKKRLIASLASLLVLAGAGVGALFWWRAESRSRVTHEVALIIADARSREARGEWAAAEERALHADAVLAGAGTGGSTRREVSGLVERYRARKIEGEALQRLADLRMHSNSPPPEMDRHYAEEFQALGLDIDLLEPATVGTLIRRHGPAVTEQLVLALDDWSLRFGSDDAGSPSRVAEDKRPPPPARRDPRVSPNRRKRVLRAAIMADTHVWRNRLREAILAGDREALSGVARSIETERPPASSLILLSHEMEDGAASIDVLQRAYRLYPDDFWVNFFIADATLPGGGRTDARRLELCERHSRLTVSLNPKNPHAHALLAAALLARSGTPAARADDRDEALQALRTAAALDPGPFGEIAALALRAAGTREPGAREEIRRRLEGEPAAPPLIRALLEQSLR